MPRIPSKFVIIKYKGKTFRVPAESVANAKLAKKTAASIVNKAMPGALQSLKTFGKVLAGKAGAKKRVNVDSEIDALQKKLMQRNKNLRGILGK